MTDVRPELTRSSMIALVWRSLEAHPGARPSVADIAQATSVPVRQLRRACRRAGHEPLRTLITFGCLSWGWMLIAQGVKPTAASRLAGFRNHWNFNRQTQRWAGRSSKDLAKSLPDHLPIDEQMVAWRRLDAGLAARPLESAFAVLLQGTAPFRESSAGPGASDSET